MDGRELKRTLAVHAQIARVYADDRFPPSRSSLDTDLRLFAVTVLWVLGIERPAHGGKWKRICDVLHLDNRRFWWTIEQDVPRWEPPGNPAVMGGCEAPMIRRGGLCGKRGSTSFRVTNPEDGTWHHAAFCSRHWDYSREVHRAERGNWKPPAVGICADDWPVMARVTTMAPPKLALINGEMAGEAAPLPQGERQAPSLRLVKDEG